MTAEIVYLPIEDQISELALKSAAAWQMAKKAVAAAEKIDAELAAIRTSWRWRVVPGIKRDKAE